MRVNISAKTFDISAVMEINTLPENTQGAMARRANRVATLDGGVSLNDMGYSHGDRDIQLIYKSVSDTHDTIARRLVELHSRVILSMPEGCFEAVPEAFEAVANRNTFSLLIVDKISED